MNHKTIIKILAFFFSVSIFNSFLSIFIDFPISPEFLYVLLFSVSIIALILFFKREDKAVINNKKKYINVINQNLFICQKKSISEKSNLFLRVSIITLISGILRKR